jgi:hypothetical protein
MRTFTLILAMMLSGMLLQAQTGEPCPGEPTVTYDGQTYNTILVGDKCWLKEKGRPIPENDIWNIALAKQHNIKLVSRDIHFKNVENLKLIIW